MNTYPVILKSKSENDTRIMLAYNKNEAARISSEPIDLFCGFNFDTSDAWENITREYLRNTYGKVESKEHADFLIKLAEKNKIELGVNGCSERRNYFYFTEDEDLLYLVFTSFYPSNKHTSITIPLPTKESEEWPLVGDEVLTASKQKADVIAVDSNEAWIKYKDTAIGSGYASVAIATLSKPPTPEEELESKIDKYLKVELSSPLIRNLTRAIINGEIKGVSYKPE